MNLEIRLMMKEDMKNGTMLPLILYFLHVEVQRLAEFITVRQREQKVKFNGGSLAQPLMEIVQFELVMELKKMILNYSNLLMALVLIILEDFHATAEYQH